MAGFCWEGREMKPHADISWRDINGELVALNVKSGEYFIFNEIGRMVWLAIAGGQDSSETVKKVIDEYEVNEQDASRDVEVFVKALEERSIVVLTQS